MQSLVRLDHHDWKILGPIMQVVVLRVNPKDTLARHTQDERKTSNLSIIVRSCWLQQ